MKLRSSSPTLAVILCATVLCSCTKSSTSLANESGGNPQSSGQVIKIPEQQARFCTFWDNWTLRHGYALGAEPKPPDPNSIKAAREPKPPAPGNFFDQMIALLSTTGSIDGWKGTVTFQVDGQFIHLGVYLYCPGPNGSNGI